MSTHKQLTAGTFDSLHTGPVGSLQLSAVMPVAEVQRAALWQDAPTQAAAHEQGKGVKVAIDLAAGTFGGIAQLVVGHPFDTIKVGNCSRDRGQHKSFVCWPAAAAWPSMCLLGLVYLAACSDCSRKPEVYPVPFQFNSACARR